MACACCDATVRLHVGVDGDARAAPLTFFVDELLGLVFRVDVSGGLPAACEVAVACRCNAPVVSGRVPPDITPWSGGRAGDRDALDCHWRRQKPSRRSSDDSLGRRGEPRFGRLPF